MNSKRNNNDQPQGAAPAGAADEERQAQRLYDFLRGSLPQTALPPAAALTQDAPGGPAQMPANLPAGEAALGQALLALADQTRPDEAFQARLQAQLHTAARRKQNRAIFWSAGRLLAGAVGVLLLVAGLTWSIRTLVSRPVTAELATPTTRPAATATGALPGVATSGPPASATPQSEQATPPASATPQAPLQVYNSPILPDLGLVLQAPFPEAPAEMTVYEQIAWPALTVEAARQVAARLGLPPAAYTPPGQAPGFSSLTFTDGFQRLNFANSVTQFGYFADASAALTGESPAPLEPAQIAEIEAWLKQNGLLDFAYRIDDPLLAGQSASAVVFTQLLDGFPLINSGFYGPRLVAQTDAAGQIRSLDSFPANVQALGAYHIRSAEDAWRLATDPQMPMGVETNTFTPLVMPAHWQRSYPTGQAQTVYANLEILQPVEPGGEPRLFLEGAPLSGEIAGLAQLPPGQQFIQADGQFQPGEGGERAFVVESWQVSDLTMENPAGVVEFEDGQAYLAAGERRYRLPDAPDDLQSGMAVMVSAVILEGPEPALEWNWIYAEPFGWGGGGGGQSFLDLNLDGPPVATPTPYPLPTVQAGRRLEGVTGVPTVILCQYADGSRRLEADIYIEPNQDFPDGLSLRLQGAALEGIEAYHMLPVRIWGALSGKTVGMIIYLDLERFEPVYPGVKMQAWLGRLEAVTLEGKQAARLTTPDGQQYLLNSALQDAYRLEWMPLGETVIVEGALYPDQSFGGLPVLQDQNLTMALGIPDVSEYELQFAAPQVIEEIGSASLPRQALIDKIELVYHTAGLPGPGEESLGPSYIQPIWRFTGRYPDGSLFEILVQALADEYLKAWDY
jgi:hypothetical protein